MANESVVGRLRILLSMDSAEFQKATQTAATQARALERSLTSTGRQLTSVGAALTKTLTVPIVGLAAASAKAAIDFESSFAGVRKTVNATEAQFASLAQGMRDLSKTIPINVNELNKIGEAAGQLGIKTDNILGFTEVMAKLGVTTNLSADQAATSLARLANITGMPQTSFDRLGSTIVDLGNNFATTEAEIVDFGLRIAGAGKIAGLSEHQILAIGSAMSSVGVQAEAGGTAVQKVLNGMTEAVATGGKELQTFAATAGMSAEQFASAFREDAANAFNLFVQGLGKQGDQAFVTLDKLKLGNERVIRAFLSLANAGDLLTRNLDVAANAWQRNTALTEEARKRFETTASQLTVLWNRVKDVGITVGNALLPAIQSAIGLTNTLLPIVERLAQGFADLPGPVQLVAVGLLAVVAAAGPVLFAMGQLALAAGAITKAFTAKGIATQLLTGRFGGLASAAVLLAGKIGILAVAFGTLWAAMKAGDTGPAKDVQDGFQFWLLTSNQASASVVRLALGLDQLTHAQAKATIEANRAAVAQQGLKDIELPATMAETAAATDGLTSSTTRLTEATEEQKKAALAWQEEAKRLTQEYLLGEFQAAEAVTRAKYDQFDAIEARSQEFLLSEFQAAEAATRAKYDQLDAEQKAYDEFYEWLEQRRMEDAAAALAVQRQSLISQIGSNLAAGLGPAILGAFQGGGNVGKSIGGALGGNLGATLGSSLSKQLGGTLGSIVGSIVPGLGTLLGGLAGGLIGKIFGKSEAEKVRDLTGEVIRSAGGFDALAAKIHLATGSQELFQRLLDAKTEREYEAAVRDIDAALGALSQRLRELQGAAGDVTGRMSELRTISPELQAALETAYNAQTPQEYADALDRVNREVDTALQKQRAADDAFAALGFTFAQLPKNVRNQKLGEEFTKWGKHIESAVEAGADLNFTIGKAGPELSKLVLQAEKTGTQIPAHMRPILEQAARLGVLTDANGKKIDLARLATLEYGDDAKAEQEKVKSAMDLVIQALDRIIARLEALDGTTVDTHVNVHETHYRNTIETEGSSHGDSGTASSSDDGNFDYTRPYYIDEHGNPQYAARGGLITPRGIQRFAGGGIVAPSSIFQPRGTDTVPAMLTPGEVVLNADQQTLIDRLIAAQQAGRSVVIENRLLMDGQEMKRWLRTVHVQDTENNTAGYRTQQREALGIA